MNDHADHSNPQHNKGAALFSALLALVWGAYGVWVCYEIFTVPPG